MMPYLYDDEDNAPMTEENYDRIDQNGHNPMVYGSYAEMRAAEKSLPFTDPLPYGCWNCKEYDGTFCTKFWNNLDECYKDTERDLREPDDRCEDWEEYKDAVWEDFHGTDT